MDMQMIFVIVCIIALVLQGIVNAIFLFKVKDFKESADAYILELQQENADLRAKIVLLE